MYLAIEIIIFITEMIVLGIALGEHKRWVAVLFVFVANLASLVLGAFVLTILPV